MQKKSCYYWQGLNCCSKATVIPLDSLSAKDITPKTNPPIKHKFNQAFLNHQKRKHFKTNLILCFFQLGWWLMTTK